MYMLDQTTSPLVYILVRFLTLQLGQYLQGRIDSLLHLIAVVYGSFFKFVLGWDLARIGPIHKPIGGPIQSKVLLSSKKFKDLSFVTGGLDR